MFHFYWGGPLLFGPLQCMFLKGSGPPDLPWNRRAWSWLYYDIILKWQKCLFWRTNKVINHKFHQCLCYDWEFCFLHRKVFVTSIMHLRFKQILNNNWCIVDWFSSDDIDNIKSSKSENAKLAGSSRASNCDVIMMFNKFLVLRNIKTIIYHESCQGNRSSHVNVLHQTKRSRC